VSFADQVLFYPTRCCGHLESTHLDYLGEHLNYYFYLKHPLKSQSYCWYYLFNLDRLVWPLYKSSSKSYQACFRFKEPVFYLRSYFVVEPDLKEFPEDASTNLEL